MKRKRLNRNVTIVIEAVGYSLCLIAIPAVAYAVAMISFGGWQ